MLRIALSCSRSSPYRLWASLLAIDQDTTIMYLSPLSHHIQPFFFVPLTSSLSAPSCMNSSTGPSHSACPLTPAEQTQPSPGGSPKLVTQIQHIYSYSWPMFTLNHQTPVPFIDPGMTPHPFWPYSASGLFSFSAMLSYPYYMCSPTHSDPSPYPGPSVHGHTYSPLVSPVSDTFIHEYHKSNTKNKGKFFRYFPSSSHSLSTPLPTSVLATPSCSVAPIPMYTPALRQTPNMLRSYASPCTPAIPLCPTPLHTPFRLDIQPLPLTPVI